MGRRKTGLAEEIFTLIAAAPWWLGVVLAAAALVTLQLAAGMEVRPPANAKGAGSFVVLQAIKSGASLLRWLLPPLLLAAAGVSYLKQRRTSTAAAAPPARGSSQRRPLAELDETWDADIRQRREPRFDLPSVPANRPTKWSADVLNRMDWKRFEALTAAYYKHLGFRAETIQCGPDGGIDVKLFRGDESSPAAIVQCKAWMNRQVGVKPVRELLGVMVHNKVESGVFLTTSNFTADAHEFAKSHKIALGTGEQLLGKLRALPDEPRRKLLEVAVEGDWTTPSCPSCGTKMVLRDGSGKRFWGCSAYPRCRRMFPLRAEEHAADERS
jgi:restriction system protein